jgi:hypothetical protein
MSHGAFQTACNQDVNEGKLVYFQSNGKLEVRVYGFHMREEVS